jgi:hypothetical protein
MGAVLHPLSMVQRNVRVHFVLSVLKLYELSKTKLQSEPWMRLMKETRTKITHFLRSTLHFDSKSIAKLCTTISIGNDTGRGKLLSTPCRRLCRMLVLRIWLNFYSLEKGDNTLIPRKWTGVKTGFNSCLCLRCCSPGKCPSPGGQRLGYH